MGVWGVAPDLEINTIVSKHIDYHTTINMFFTNKSFNLLNMFLIYFKIDLKIFFY